MCKGCRVVVVIVVIVDTKIAKSGDLGTWGSCKRNEYVKFGEKLASVCSESSSTAYQCHKLCIIILVKLAIVATPIDRAHYVLCM